VGTDRQGDAFAALLDTEGIDPILARKRTPTGSSVIVVTPDSQRTMFTYLGACREFGPDDLSLERIRSGRILHLAGYMWDTPNQEKAARKAAEVARGANTLVSFDVADSFVVDRYRDSILEWVPRNVQLLFANGDELRALTGASGDDESVLAAAEHLAPTVVMKVGANGCHVRHRGTTLSVPAHPAERFDTTGAGDAFAGGYLYGLMQKLPPGECARIANILAAGIVSVDGCNYDALDDAEIRASIHSTG
jgi:sugar/nucleoside kinase (ribokinase family)